MTPSKLQKEGKKYQEAHSANTKYGMGDYYGTGVKNKIGRVRDMTPGVNPLPPAKLRKPPKALA